MQRTQRYNAAAHKHQQATPCVCDTPICAVLLLLVVCLGACGPYNPQSTFLQLCAVCDRSKLALGGNVRTVWIKYEYTSTVLNISDVLCFFPAAHPRNLDIRRHAENHKQRYNPD